MNPAFNLNILNFQDPANLFAYNMISLHHDIMWYIIIILSIVYWSLFKILWDFSWHVSYKRRGLILAFFESIYYRDRFAKWYIKFMSYTAFKFWKFYHYLKELLYLFIYIAIKAHIWFPYPSSYFRPEDTFYSKTLYYLLKCFSFFFGIEFYIGLRFPVTLMEMFQETYMWDDELDYLIDQQLMAFLLGNFSNRYKGLYDEWHDETLDVNSFNHSITLEYIYGLFPTTIVLLILAPSLFLLYSVDEDINPVLTIKVIGHQWYWSYEFDTFLTYPILGDNNDIVQEAVTFDVHYDSVLIPESDLPLGGKRLLEVTKPVFVPTNVTIRFLVTSADVLHSWSIPELGIKVDAVPGRLNQVITMVNRPGVFYGQCSELCGVAHGFMPIVLKASTIKRFYLDVLRADLSPEDIIACVNSIYD